MGAFFHAGALGGRLRRLVEEPALHACMANKPIRFLFGNFFEWLG